MARLIDADELIEIAHRIRLDSRERIERMIESAPTVDPIKHGHWIEHDIGLICSECNHYTEAMYDEPFNNELGIGWAWRRPYYCGYCGAKMDEVRNERD